MSEQTGCPIHALGDDSLHGSSMSPGNFRVCLARLLSLGVNCGCNVDDTKDIFLGTVYYVLRTIIVIIIGGRQSG